LHNCAGEYFYLFIFVIYYLHVKYRTRSVKANTL